METSAGGTRKIVLKTSARERSLRVSSNVLRSAPCKGVNTRVGFSPLEENQSEFHLWNSACVSKDYKSRSKSRRLREYRLHFELVRIVQQILPAYQRLIPLEKSLGDAVYSGIGPTSRVLRGLERSLVVESPHS